MNMKVLVCFLSLVAIACAQVRLIPSLRFPLLRAPVAVDEVYAASLGGAPVGLYDRTHLGGWGGLGGLRGFPYGLGRGDEVVGASLGGAPVGLYDKTRGGLGGIRGLGRGDLVNSASLGGAKVGVYGKDKPVRG